ncbi:cytochrome c biogenesis protein ResB [Nakamurella lactea]|uniref:cytochrome c biogenesis protein ResB n=1 Tax=Nakamurella lactea TaxID=459515 RepID=UPI0003FE741F|nr:cytochrome c biogenesis protein ResB [Nakamurella lactea]
MSATDTTTVPSGGQVPPARRRVRPAIAFLRNTWRGLTSMRTALILLFLLALASLPGALLPQWSLNESKTSDYIAAHPFWGPLMNRLGFFEVFASPWYSAIYLLLFISLVGCLLPRTFEFARQIGARPVSTPRNLARMPLHAEYTVDGTAEQAADRAEATLRRKHWRVSRRTESGGVHTLSAEKGYLREVGNLVFHFSLLALLIAVAIGKLFGYEGSVIVQVGDPWCSSSTSSYDNFRPGLTVDGTDMTPFCLQIKDFQATWSPSGQALSFHTDVNYQAAAEAGGDSWHSARVQVNDPLRMAGERLYLLGHGYAPDVKVTFPNGDVRNYSTPFISNDPMLLSTGAIKVPDPPGVPADQLTQHQLAIAGLFAPTAAEHGGIMTSVYPAADKPGLAVDIYRGDLGMEGGRPQSVYAISQDQVDKGALVKLDRVNLYVGDSTTLDDGTVITFTGYHEWVSLQTSYDPGQTLALIAAILLLAGLMASLTIKRRRLWFRLLPPEAGSGAGDELRRTVVRVGGLARTDQAGYGAEFDEVSRWADDGTGSDTGTDEGTATADGTTGTTGSNTGTDGTAAERE